MVLGGGVHDYRGLRVTFKTDIVAGDVGASEKRGNWSDQWIALVVALMREYPIWAFRPTGNRVMYN